MENKGLWHTVGEWAAQLMKIGGGATVLVLFLAALTDYTPLRDKIADIAGTYKLISSIDSLANSADRLTDKTEDIAGRLEKVEDRLNYADQNGLGGRAPAVKFLESGHSITDAKVGGTVVIHVRYIKLRDCGRPKIVAWFKNGRKLPHTFRDLSILGPDGRPPARKADPQEVIEGQFLARIPGNDSVTSGNAYGWVEVGEYEFCPNVSTVSSPQIPFIILDGYAPAPERRQ
jgi:hypothetical protein